MKQKIFACCLLLSSALLAGCVSDDDVYEGRPGYSRNFDAEQRDRNREEWQRREAQRAEMDRREDAAYREARDHRRFCAQSPSSLFCRYD
ncbi:hypothetical protein [Rhizobium sp. ICMP 5592]|uniref:hypothetical protein n=1 Tax=Rhizobium sp. ICMP 5592 TaxID=2292445 RepID=UPI001297DCDB|nr:hypothetical protein [Rhizobium sp. ICMP 5592]